MEERKLRQPEEKQELSELWELFRSQERELHEMRIRLSRFMTKGAQVFLQTPKIEGKSSGYKSKFQPHVHFSRSITNGSSAEQNDVENIAGSLDDMQKKIHKGRPHFHGQSQQMPERDYTGKIFEDPDGLNVNPDVSNDGPTSSRKKSMKKPSGGARPKSSRTLGHEKRGKSTGMGVSQSNRFGEDDIKDELQMENEGLPSIGYEPDAPAESKHTASNDSEIGDVNDDTSKDITSLSLATASASGTLQQQTTPKISVTNDAQ